MLRVKNNTIPEAFCTKFQIVQYNYPIRHSKTKFDKPKMTFKFTKFATSSRGSRLWNKYTDKFLKTITSFLLFKTKLREHLVKLRIVTDYFFKKR